MEIDGFLGSPITWGVIGLILAAIAFSGRLSVYGANITLGAAWLVGCYGIYRSDLARDPRVLIVFCALLAIPLALLSYWFTPTHSQPAQAPSIQSSDSPSPYVIGRVLIASAEPFYRLYQHPPAYFERIDTELYMTITNTTTAPLYVQGYSVVALVRGQQWRNFQNLIGLGLDPEEIGLISPKSSYLSRIDLSKNGFDFLMKRGPLGPNEAIEAWMFFKSGLSGSDLFQVTQFRITIVDSTQRQHTFFCDFPSATGSMVGTLKVLPREPIPQGLREMPPVTP